MQKQLLNIWQSLKEEIDNITEIQFDDICHQNVSTAKVNNRNHEVNHKNHKSACYEFVYKSEDQKREGNKPEDFDQVKWSINFYWTVCPDGCGIRKKKIIAWNTLDSIAYENLLVDSDQKQNYSI